MNSRISEAMNFVKLNGPRVQIRFILQSKTGEAELELKSFQAIPMTEAQPPILNLYLSNPNTVDEPIPQPPPEVELPKEGVIRYTEGKGY